MKPPHLENPQLVCYPRHRVSGTWQLFSAAVVETAPIGVFDVTSHNPHFRFSQSVLDHNAKKKGTLALWPHDWVPCRRAAGRGGRTVESGGVPPETARRSTPATHSGTRDEDTEAARFQAYSRKRESGSCCRSSDTSAPSLTIHRL